MTINGKTGVNIQENGSTIIGIDDDQNVSLTLGSDAEGDMYYRDSSGKLARIAVGSGTDNYVLTLNGNVPGWEAASGGGSGDITGVEAGTGLSGGGTSGDVTLSVNAAQTSITSIINSSLTKIQFDKT